MVKMLYCMRRLPHLSEEEFYRYWKEKHTPLARQLAPAINLRRYVQIRTLDVPFNEIHRRSRGLGAPFDNAGELWWESVDEMIDALSSEPGLEANMALLQDEGNFIDFSSSCAWICEDHVIYEKG